MQITDLDTFIEFIKLVLTPEAGYYIRPHSQEKAISVFEKARDVETVGLEVIIGESFLGERFNGVETVTCEIFSVLLIQNPSDAKQNLQRALRKLQLNILEHGRIHEIVQVKDEDFTQGTRKVIFYSVWIPKCRCGYDPCEDPMVVI